jgi:integrase
MRPAWLDAVRSLPDDKPPALTGTQRDALLLLIGTGLRLREGIRLKWSEVDLARGVITIGADRMKGGDAHEVPVPRRTFAMLERRRKAAPDANYVFANGDKPIDRISVHVFERIDVRATPHDLRRSIATWLGTNAPGYVVKQILSHADPAKSRDISERYVQRNIDVLRVWLQKWEDALYAAPKRARK